MSLRESAEKATQKKIQELTAKKHANRREEKRLIRLIEEREIEEREKEDKEDQEVDNLISLFNHFGISLGDPRGWQTLAMALARKHYPNGIKKPGRKPKLKNALALPMFKKPSKLGRKPSGITELAYRSVSAEIQKSGRSGRGAVKAACALLADKFLSSIGEANNSELFEKERLRLQKIYSRKKGAILKKPQKSTH